MLNLNIWMGRTKVLQMLCKIIKDKRPLNAEFLDLQNSFKTAFTGMVAPSAQHH
jgi:hypothetical protein